MHGMEKRRVAAVVFFLLMVLMAFAAGFSWAVHAHAAEGKQDTAKDRRTVYPSRTELDFEGTAIEGEVKNPGEFYFQRKPEEKFDSLVKRRPDFRREMLRDVVLSK